MNTIPSVFNFNSAAVRTVVINDDPWFVASDVCAVLGIKNHRDALMHLDADERGVVLNDTPSMNQHGSFGTVKQEISVINESGLYSLVLRSRKPEAKPFIKWVTKEVLPAIRKTGQYIAQPYAVNHGDTLNATQADTLRNMLTEAAQAMPKDLQGLVMREGWSKLKAHFNCSYRQIHLAEFNEAVSLLSRHIVHWKRAKVTDSDIVPNLQEIQDSYALAIALLPETQKAIQSGLSNTNRRWFLSFDGQHKPNIQTIPDDAYVLSHADMLKAMLSGDGLPMKNEELEMFIHAATRNLANRAEFYRQRAEFQHLT